MKEREILLTITTIIPSAWHQRVEEAEKLGLKEVALFLTCLKLAERKELYRLLERTHIEKIPFVHLRADMEFWELDYLIEHYQAKAFNLHTQREYPFLYDYQKYKNFIYIENTYEPFDEKEINEFAGVCIDFSHLENSRRFYPDIYRHNIGVIEKYPCGCNHIGPAQNFPFLDKDVGGSEYQHPSHLLENLSEFDYLKRYPQKYFSPYIAIELEENLETQLKVRDYIINLLRKDDKGRRF